jgi:protoporphyrinogen oxidase
MQSGWLINGENKVDLIVSTMPLNLILSILTSVPNEVISAAKLLKYNKVSNMLWETDPVDATWTYYPESTTIFHRHIHIGNFLLPKSNHTITEVIGEVSHEEMEKAGKEIDYLRKPIGFNTSDHAYVVFDHNYNKSVKTIKNYLDSIGVITLGRFGEWEYYNMDICIESAMKISNNLIYKKG